MLSKRLIGFSVGTLLILFVILGASSEQIQPNSPDFSVLDESNHNGDLPLLSIEPAQAETLSYVIQAGEVLILNLPGTLGVQEVDSYRIVKAPALSWLVTRSFFWRTLAKDVGAHEMKFKAVVKGRDIEDVVALVDVR